MLIPARLLSSGALLNAMNSEHVFGVLGIVRGPVTFATAAALVQVLTDANDTIDRAEPATHAAAAVQDG